MSEPYSKLHYLTAKHLFVPYHTPHNFLHSTFHHSVCTTTTQLPTLDVVVVTKLCPTLCDPTDCRRPGSFVHWISQARILEWVAVFFFFPQGIFPTQGLNLCLLHCRFFIIWVTRETRLERELWRKRSRRECLRSPWKAHEKVNHLKHCQADEAKMASYSWCSSPSFLFDSDEDSGLRLFFFFATTSDQGTF